MNKQREKGSEGGFTLIEMAIVLAVIGLILGAVSIGKDVQRDAEYTKVKQKFIDGWAQAYNAYYQRTGVVLGDSQVSPRIMVAGVDHAVVSGVVSGGDMSGVTSPGSICQTSAPLGALAVAATGGTTLHSFFDQAGVRMPPGRAEGEEDRYVYLDSNGNPQQIQVCFQWNPASTPAGAGNVMIIAGLTPDLARMLDQTIDGKPDAQEGMFRQSGIANGTSGAAGVAWKGNNSQAFGTTGSATGGTSLDEDQVITLTAVYKMNQ